MSNKNIVSISLMCKELFLLIVLFFFLAEPSNAESLPRKNMEEGTHLFIFSGQSNMARFKTKDVFQPIVEDEFGSENVIIVKEAKGGQPISRWYKNWKSVNGEMPESTGDIYDVLMEKVRLAIKDKSLASVTFFWMQGEQDAKVSQGEVYEESLKGLLAQLQLDLQFNEINFVCGRLSDFGMDNKKCPHWMMIRDIQQSFAESYSNGAWINTDDLNDGLDKKGRDRQNALHYTVEGYKILGERYAEKAIKLINGK
ncbi:sialate O-acetylesterase [Labilibacter sediminis]|nr:sialate O-acetylesterase [Labilibacter sediminis]